MRRIVIVGGVAGGATAAARLRRLDEQAEIILLERGEHISYANCGLPYYAGGVIRERDDLFLMTPAGFRARLAVDVRTGNEAVAIDPERRIVTVRELASGRVYEERYDALLLSPGAEPVRPPIPGIDDARIFTIRSVPDIDRVKHVLDTAQPGRAVVIGGGFVGLEMAENLHARGLETTVVEAQDQVMAVIDCEMAAIVHQHLRETGVGLHLGDGVAAFVPGGDGLEVYLKSGRVLTADLVILAIGVKPESTLARQAGLTLDERGFIVVDERLRTSAPGIYAVGDAVALPSPFTGRPAAVPLAGPANKQARVAAENIVLGDAAPVYRGTLGTAIAKVFDLAVASTGLSEKACQREGISCRSVIIHPAHHAGYYPGAQTLTLKVVFHPETGKVLGAQAVGREGVDKRIDVLAALIGMGADVHDLEAFEHAYAPPFAGAKDAVNHAGFVAANLLAGLSKQVSWQDVDRLRQEGAVLLDVRSPAEFAEGHITGAMLIPGTELRGRLAEVPRDRPVVVYCAVGIRGYLAERILRQHGFTDVVNLAGGFKTFRLTAPAAVTVPGQAVAPAVATKLQLSV